MPTGSLEAFFLRFKCGNRTPRARERERCRAPQATDGVYMAKSILQRIFPRRFKLEWHAACERDAEHRKQQGSTAKACRRRLCVALAIGRTKVRNDDGICLSSKNDGTSGNTAEGGTDLISSCCKSPKKLSSSEGTDLVSS